MKRQLCIALVSPHKVDRGYSSVCVWYVGCSLISQISRPNSADQ